MCGFLVNISNKKLSKKKINDVNESLFKRGPDQEGYISYNTNTGNNIEMLHRRLEILGIGDSGSQPMENDKFTIVFNGEIYNHMELSSFLGEDYKNDGDTKVLLDMISEFGIKNTIQLIKGIFSFVILDKLNEKIYLHRDCFGTKPLYIFKENNIFTVASNVESIRVVNDDLSIGNLTELGEIFFLMFGFTFISKDTTKRISELDPGKLLELNINTFQFKNINLDNSKKIFDVNNNWQQDIKDSFNSDVPLSILLSGGIDSAFVASMNRIIKKKDIYTYTLSNTSGSNYLDVKKAKLIARKLNLKNFQINLNQKIIQKEIKYYINNMEYPTDDGLNIFLASKEIRKMDRKVCLTGLGGDEFFGGYSTSKKNILKYFIRKSYLWKFIPLFKNLMINNGFGGYLRLSSIDPSRLLGYLYGKAFIFRDMPNKIIDKAINKFSKVLIRRLPNGFPNSFEYESRISLLEIYAYCIPQLVKDADTFAMANSVELRPSLLINSLLEKLINRINYKEQFNGKNFLIDKMDNDIAENLNLRKIGFTVDLDVFLKNNFNKIYKLILTDKNNLKYKNLLDEFKKIISKKKKLSNRKKYFLWRLYILSSWKNNK